MTLARRSRDRCTWTVEEDAKVLAFATSGLSQRQIAGRMGRSEDAVYARLYLLRQRAKPDETPMAYVDRDPCGFCGTRRDIGCGHYPKVRA